MSNTVSVTLTLPEEIVHRIDRERGDVNRSRYLLRLIEIAYSHYQEDIRRKRRDKV
jgi:hypothetical protein